MEMMILSSILAALSVVFLIQAALKALQKDYDLELRSRKGIVVSRSVVVVSVLSALVIVLFVNLKWNSYGLVRMILQILLLWGMAVLTVTDYKKQVVPNRFLLILLAIWVLVASGGMIVNFSTGLFLVAQSMLGAFVGTVIFGLCYILAKKQLGAGDIKLAAVIGLYMLPDCSICAYLIGSVLCCLYSILQIIRKKLGWRDSIPMVPFLTLGVWSALFLIQ